jgi:uncharacterized SAM-dependent methyltransferase
VTEQQGQELQQQIGALEYFEITTSEIEVLDLLATEVTRTTCTSDTTQRDTTRHAHG